MEGHEDKQQTQTCQECTERTDTGWDHADHWTDADWSSDWSTDLWTDPAWEQAARQLPSTQPAQEQSNPTHGGSISRLGRLTMCELSVNEKSSKVNKMTMTENLCNDWNDKMENWIPIEMMHGHKIEN